MKKSDRDKMSDKEYEAYETEKIKIFNRAFIKKTLGEGVKASQID